ncbi:MAG: TatD family hydrolase [Clostridia bacterium]|nr:TatD family hydrolase [Clostridia bacterium]
MLIDTHTHLDDSKFDGDREAIIETLFADGVEFVINNASNLNTCVSSLALAERYGNIFCALGCHPHDAKNYNDQCEEFILENASNAKVVALGEIGLDYFYDFSDRNAQKKVFCRQLELAKELQLPTVLHIRDAYGDAKDILDEYKECLGAGVILHCFSGSKEYAADLKGFETFFGFGGTSTYKNAKKDEIMKAVGAGKVLSETDCPYLSPQKLRGTRNQPKNVGFVVEYMAQVFGLSMSDMEKVLRENTLKAFPKVRSFLSKANPHLSE